MARGEVIVDPGPSSCLERLLPVLDEAGFVARVRARAAGSAAVEAGAVEPAAAYGQALPPAQSFQGLARYLRGRQTK